MPQRTGGVNATGGCDEHGSRICGAGRQTQRLVWMRRVQEKPVKERSVKDRKGRGLLWDDTPPPAVIVPLIGYRLEPRLT